MENQTFTIITDNNEEILCEIVFTFHSDEFEKSYVIYRPIESEDEETVFVASYNEEEGGFEGNLEEVTDAEEWEMIEEVLGAFSEE